LGADGHPVGGWTWIAFSLSGTLGLTAAVESKW
jgi:hypothetical protein